MRLNELYHDRGIKKYNGFFLSEHTSDLEKVQRISDQKIMGKEQMSEELIFEIIDFSIFKSRKVAIQLNIKDIEGNFLEDITGFISGYDENAIYIEEVKVPLHLIRHIVELEYTRWFN